MKSRILTGMEKGKSVLLFLALPLLFSIKINAQNESQVDTTKNNYQLLFELNLDATHFTTDKLQNIYFITRKNEVVKLKPDGTEQFRFINKTLGTPTYLDATNPFNLLLFYPDYQSVLTLDRTMNLAGQFNLFELGLFGLGAVGMAGDGNLWLYDQLNFRLKKIGRDGQVFVRSGDLSLELNQSITPNFILERNQKVYLNDPALGILVFDVFGKYLKKIPILELEEFQVVGEELLFCKNDQMHSFHLVTLLQNPVKLPLSISAGGQVRVQKDRLYIIRGGKLQVYQL